MELQINDNLKFSHNFVNTQNTIYQMDNSYLKSPYQKKMYEDTNNTFLLNYDDHKGLTGYASYGTQERNYDQDTYNKKTGAISEAIQYSWRKGHNTNLNLQKVFNIGKEDTFLFGASFKREDMDVKSAGTKRWGILQQNQPKRELTTVMYIHSMHPIIGTWQKKIK